MLQTDIANRMMAYKMAEGVLTEFSPGLADMPGFLQDMTLQLIGRIPTGDYGHDEFSKKLFCEAHSLLASYDPGLIYAGRTVN